MNNEIIIIENQITYTAEYFIEDDTLTVILPNGELRINDLRGLTPEQAAKTHLQFYIKSKN